MPSIPDPASTDAAEAYAKPDEAPVNPLPADDALARRGVLQIRAFAGGITRGRAAELVTYWRHFATLTPAQLITIVDEFPPGPDDEEPEPHVHRGGGWISGPSQGSDE